MRSSTRGVVLNLRIIFNVLPLGNRCLSLTVVLLHITKTWGKPQCYILFMLITLKLQTFKSQRNLRRNWFRCLAWNYAWRWIAISAIDCIYILYLIPNFFLTEELCFNLAAITCSWIYVHWLWHFRIETVALVHSALWWRIQRFERVQSVLWGYSWASSTKNEGWEIWHWCFKIWQATQYWGFTGVVFYTITTFALDFIVKYLYFEVKNIKLIY